MTRKMLIDTKAPLEQGRTIITSSAFCDRCKILLGSKAYYVEDHKKVMCRECVKTGYCGASPCWLGNVKVVEE